MTLPWVGKYRVEIRENEFYMDISVKVNTTRADYISVYFSMVQDNPMKHGLLALLLEVQDLLYINGF